MEIESLTSVLSEAAPWTLRGGTQARTDGTLEQRDTDRFFDSLDAIPRLQADPRDKHRIAQAVNDMQDGLLDTAENARLAAQFLLKFGL
ncbi:MAG: hypothetical protein JW828_16120 [Sedimentisphaerales bacterium]|nr:hypothetical protein [Sedimentisphaerales bacterium]